MHFKMLDRCARLVPWSWTRARKTAKYAKLEKEYDSVDEIKEGNGGNSEKQEVMEKDCLKVLAGFSEVEKTKDLEEMMSWFWETKF
jgi:hypothetical protein